MQINNIFSTNISMFCDKENKNKKSRTIVFQEIKKYQKSIDFPISKRLF